MDFAIPDDIQKILDQLDVFIEKEIKPLQAQDDNERFFDHRREWARTDFENDGVPREDWEQLLREMRRRADEAGWLRLALPKEFGGQGATDVHCPHCPIIYGARIRFCRLCTSRRGKGASRFNCVLG